MSQGGSADGWPDGTATFVFSDIVGSTALVHALGDNYMPLLADHNMLLREAWSSGGGEVVKTDGDSFFVVFADAGDAIRACVAAQRALAAHTWLDNVRLHVRMGAHTGEATLVGKDYFGLGVIVASRVMSAAHGDQIIVTDSAHSVAGLDDDISIRELGRHGLKGVADAPTLYQIVADGLPSVFPPPATLRAVRHSIPHPPSPLRGRQDLIPQAHDLLLGDARVVSVVGTGGIGKTRFAMEVAHDLLAYMPGGVFWIDCAPLSSDEAVTAAIANELGIELVADAASQEQIAASLEATTLFVLDNLEHLPDIAHVISGLVTATPHAQILATSRHRLRIRTENVLALDPLEVPRADETTLPAVADTPAGAVFLDRAKATDLTRVWSDGDAPALTRIVRALDGVPLALELAAARLGELTLADIEVGLTRATQILADGDVDLPLRQRSMTAAIQWSIDLLDADSRESLAAASVFRGGAARDALEAVLGRAADLTALVRASLLRVEADRIRMLEPVRAAAEELAVARDAYRATHLAWFDDLAERSWRQLTGHQAPEWLARLAPETANVDAALAHTDPATALRMCANLGRFWARAGRALEGEERVRRALEQAEDDAPARAQALMVLGGLARQLGRIDQARAALEQAAALAEARGDHEIELQSRTLSGDVERLGGNLDLAAEILETVGAEARRIGSPMLAAQADVNLALVRLEDVDRADRLLRSAADVFESVGDHHNAVQVALNRSSILAAANRINEAEEVLARVEAKRSELGDANMIAHLSVNLGWLAHLKGENERAEQQTREGIDLLKQLDDRASVIGALNNLFAILEDAGDHLGALDVASEALTLRRGAPALALGLVRAAASVALETNQPARALEMLINETDDVEHGPEAAGSTLFLAMAQARLGNIPGALATLALVKDRPGSRRITDEMLRLAREAIGPEAVDAALGANA